MKRLCYALCAWLLCVACSVGEPPKPDQLQGDAALEENITQWQGLLDNPELRKEALDSLAVAISRLSPTAKEKVAAKLTPVLIDAYSVDNLREEIISLLRTLGSKEALPLFQQVVREFQPGKTDRLVAIAAEALGDQRDASSLDALVALLPKVESPFLRLKLVRALGSIEDPDKKSTSVLLDVLRTPSEKQERFITLTALLSLGNKRDNRAARSLIEALYRTEGDRSFSPWAMFALVQLGDEALDPLTRALQGKLEELQKLEKEKKILYGERGYRAARAIAELSSVVGIKAKTALIAALDEAGGPDSPREGAAYALGLLGEADTAEILAKYLDKDYPTRRIAITRALAMVGNPAVLPMLLKVMKEGQFKAEGDVVYHQTCWEAARAIALIGDETTATAFQEVITQEKDEKSKAYFGEYLAVLQAGQGCKDAACWQKLLADKNWKVQEKAAYKLANLRAKDAIGDLIKAYQTTENYELRLALLFALKRMGPGALKGDPQTTLLAFARKEEADPEKRKPYAEVVEEAQGDQPAQKLYKPKQTRYLSGDPITLSDLATEVRLTIARLDNRWNVELPRDWDW